MEVTIQSIAYGKAQTYTFSQKSFESAYKKDQFVNEIEVNDYGLLLDEQVDTRFHGGVDKAIHIGSALHLQQNPHLDKLFIGCNILVNEVDEKDICVGDIYAIGEVQVEVCQPRFPCWKIGALFGKEASRYIKEHHATGWYVRILKPGTVHISDTMNLVKKGSTLSIEALSLYIKHPPSNQSLIQEILNHEAIAKAYKDDFLFALQSNNA